MGERRDKNSVIGKEEKCNGVKGGGWVDRETTKRNDGVDDSKSFTERRFPQMPTRKGVSV